MAGQAITLEHFNRLMNKVDNLQKTVDENITKVDGLQKTVDDHIQSLEKSEIQRNNRMEIVNLKVEALECQNQALQRRISQLESYSHRDSLLFIGLKEEKEENCKTKIIDLIQQIGVCFNERTFTRVHRIGRYKQDKTRPIIVKFHHFDDREILWKKRKEFKGGIHVKESYPTEMLKRRRILQAVADRAWKLPEYKGKVFMRGDILVINNKEYTVETLHLLPAKIKSVPRMEITEGIHLFFGYTSPFSNFYPAPFIIDNTSFNCAEQYFQFKKAECYKNRKAALQIFAASDPWSQKAVGKKIGDNDDWNLSVEAHAAMKEALTAKFSQNPYLKDMLLSTKEAMLGEAASHDQVWGTGIAKTNSDAHTTAKWTGKNMLGGLLMSVRSELREK